jgi:hypothetical protein
MYVNTGRRGWSEPSSSQKVAAWLFVKSPRFLRACNKKRNTSRLADFVSVSSIPGFGTGHQNIESCRSDYRRALGTNRTARFLSGQGGSPKVTRFARIRRWRSGNGSHWHSAPRRDEHGVYERCLDRGRRVPWKGTFPLYSTSEITRGNISPHAPLKSTRE